ncbi:MAG TPA: hypothetical protein VNV66_01505, partial [Pilimelia sp.]|nr:hypothetical protein [Pilimelia sp.]
HPELSHQEFETAALVAVRVGRFVHGPAGRKIAAVRRIVAGIRQPRPESVTLRNLAAVVLGSHSVTKPLVGAFRTLWDRVCGIVDRGHSPHSSYNG